MTNEKRSMTPKEVAVASLTNALVKEYTRRDGIVDMAGGNNALMRHATAEFRRRGMATRTVPAEETHASFLAIAIRYPDVEQTRLYDAVNFFGEAIAVGMEQSGLDGKKHEAAAAIITPFNPLDLVPEFIHPKHVEDDGKEVFAYFLQGRSLLTGKSVRELSRNLATELGFKSFRDFRQTEFSVIQAFGALLRTYSKA